jgi:hypothetical protein
VRNRSSTILALVAVVAVAVVARAPVHAAPPSSCGLALPGMTAVTGTFTKDLEGSYVMVPFEVPAGSTHLRVRLCHDQPPSNGIPNAPRDVIDLGLYEARATPDHLWGPEEFRGWGGSSRLDVRIGAEGANDGGGFTTVGFNPGPIPAGEWAAELGIAAVPGPADGDPDASVSWRLEIAADSQPIDQDAVWEPAGYDSTPARAGWGWYKGDFHVHGRNSNPSDALNTAVFDYAFGDGGLDFITLSDYVGTRSWDEIGAYQAQHPGTLIIRSAEVITYRGHVNNHASARYVDHRTGPVYELRDGAMSLARAARPASDVLRAIRSAGGWTQVNHPTIFPSKVPAFANLCRGCSWEYSDAETDWSLVDAFEVQTGPAGTPGPSGNELGPNPFTPHAIAMWDALYRSGFRVTAVGASDSHKAGTPSSLTNPTEWTRSPIGEATTVVWANGLSEQSVGDAIRAGHAYVKFFGANGPDLRFTAINDDGDTAMMGDTIDGPGAVLEARVINDQPNPQPGELVVLRDGVPILVVPVPVEGTVVRIPALVEGSYRLQLHRGSAIEALTNPITLTQ